MAIEKSELMHECFPKDLHMGAARINERRQRDRGRMKAGNSETVKK